MLDALLSRFKDSPALVAPEHSKTFEACLSAFASSEDGPKLMTSASVTAQGDFWNPEDRWLARYRPYLVKDGVLTIPVKGVLLNGFPFQYGGYATGYEYIWEAYKRGMADTSVKGIVLHIHSPGGEVAGCFDLVDRMYGMRDQKPVRAFAYEYAYSAAYAVASPFPITMSRTGGVGSIGVVTSHVDASKLMDDIGYKITFIHYGKHKVDGNPYEALSPEAKARIQARIDELGELFVATVARNRKMDADAVRATEALTFSPSEAMSNGLADAVGPLDDAVAAFAADLSNNEGEEQMSDKATAAADQAAIDTARAAGVEEGKATGFAEGQKAERTRISAILDSDNGKKRPTAAFAAALDTNMTAEQAVAFLAKLPEEAPTASAAAGDTAKESAANAARFDAAMSKENPEVGANAGEGGDQPTRAQRTLSMMGVKSDRAA